MKKYFFLLFLLFLTSNLWCRNVKTTLDITITDSSKIFIGDIVVFNVEIEHQENETVNILTKVKSAVFEILLYEKNIIKKDDIYISDFKFESAFFDIGNQTIPRLEFQIMNDNNVSSVYSDSLLINVKSVITDDSVELKDVKPPLPLHLKFLDWFLPIAIIIVIVIIILLISRITRKKPIFAPKKKVTIPAHIIALKKLKKLKAKDLLSKGKIKKYYVEISWICREYLENRYKLPILELTTTEIRQYFKQNNIIQNDQFRHDAIWILYQSDRVKYAKYIPPLSEAEEIFTYLINLIDATKLIEQDETNMSASRHK